MKFSKIGAVICLMLIASSGVALAEWSGSIADQFISSMSSQDKVYCPAFAVGPANDGFPLYAVWAQGTGYTVPYEVHFSKSTDNGNTWTGTTADQMISPNDGNGVYSGGIYGARRIDIAVNSLGHIFVVWPEEYVTATFDTTLEVMMVMSTDGGATWIHSDTDFPVSDTLSHDGVNTPNIAIDTLDNIHVIWNQDDPTSLEAEIFYSYSSDNGTTWTGRSGDRIISNRNGISSFYSDIDVGPDNRIHLVWQEYVSSEDKRVQYGYSTDGGATFSCESADSVISTGAYSSSLYYPRVKAKPSAGHVHVVYCQNDTAVYVGTTDNGANWTETVIWGGESYDMYGPDLAVTSTGTMVVVVDEQAPSTTNRQIYAVYSFDYGATWSPALDPVSNYDPVPTFDRTYIPSVLITQTDVLNCLYSTNRDPSSNSYQEMAYSRNSDLGVLPGAIRGTVTELDDVTPIEGVDVTLYDDVGTPIDGDVTDANGNYYFGLIPGTYDLSFSKYTHQDISVEDVVVTENTLTQVDVLMTPVIPGTVSGNVYEETGQYPLELVTVEAVDDYDSVWAYDTTDATGYYELTIWPGTYDIRLSVELFEDTTVADVEVTNDGSVNLDVNMRWAIPADDVGPTEIEEPADFMIIGQAYTPKIMVENFGYQHQTFDLNLVITDQSAIEVYNETVSSESVDSLNFIQITFPTDFSPIMPGDYTLTATTINDGDEVTANDTYVVLLTAYLHQGYGGPDGYGYMYRDNTAPCGPEFNWIDISETGSQLNPTDHYFMSEELPIGFDFEYYGYNYSSLWVNSHGSLHIGVRDVWLMSNDCPLPDASSPVAPMVMPFWDRKEVQFEIGQGVYFEYIDDPSVDYTIVQWNASTYGEDDTLEFQVILYENGRILFQYNNVSPQFPDGQGQEATVGLEFDVPPELYGLSYLCDDDNPGNRLFNGLAIEWLKDAGLPGSISGVVTDGSTSNPIEGVYVEAIGMGLDDITNASGEYTLPDLYACDYDISFSHIDYLDTVVINITVNPDEAVTLNVEMQAPNYGYAYLVGDVNMANGTWPPAVIGSDVTYLVNYFRGLPSSPPCLVGGYWGSADANGDCLVIGSDVTKLVTYFRGLTTLSFCADYEPLWLIPDDLPEDPPGGWPNCE